MLKQITKSKAKRLIYEWKNSGQSVLSFSIEKEISRNSLYYWRKRIEGVERPGNMPGGFSEIRISNIVESGGMMSIHYPNVLELRIREG